MQWKIPRQSLDRTVREEGEDLGLERAGNMAAGWVLVGFQGRSRWFGAETARCSSSLITALLKDKARHALRVLLCMCAAVENAHSFTHVNVMNTAASLSKGFVSFLRKSHHQSVQDGSKCMRQSAVQLSAQNPGRGFSVVYICSVFCTWWKSFGFISNLNLKVKATAHFKASWHLEL